MSLSEQDPTCIRCCQPVVPGSPNVSPIPGKRIDVTGFGGAREYLTGLSAYEHIVCPDDDWPRSVSKYSSGRVVILGYGFRDPVGC